MKKLLLKGMLFIIIMTATFSILFLIISVGLPPQFKNTYQYVINDKIANLIRIKDPKIITISGSSGAFGINTDLIKKETGLETANVSLHAGFGMKFQTEISKANISKGDIVVIAYEDSQWVDNKLSPELVVTAIDDRIEKYKYVPKENYIDIIQYMPTYFFKKLDAAFVTPIKASGTYSRSSFDSSGNMTLIRPKSNLPNPVPEKKYGRVNLNKSLISNDMVSYVNDFNDYVKSKGATLVISFSPALDEVVLSNKAEISGFQSSLDERLNAPIISNINDYILGREYFFDTIFHLNSYGEIERTKLLTRDLNKFIKSNK